ncbi:MAG: Flp pilus assembly complex ATPase component TadA [Lentisphaerae bacterium]|nr:Flp pilus assembly complex ATPase component TadA [Lentisphaerota bacterium]
MSPTDETVIETIRDVGLVRPEQIEAARRRAKDDGIGVLDALIDDGIVSKMEVLKTVAMQLGMDVVVLADVEIAPEIIALVPADIARRYKVMPVVSDENTLKVAMSDPFDIETLDSLRYVLKRNVEGMVAAPDEIAIAIDHYYGREEMTVEDMLSKGEKAESVLTGVEGAEEGEEDAPIIKLVHLIILEAQRSRASDIHLEPMEKRFRIRYRIDGVLHEIENPPKRLQPAVLSRLKLMAGMKISEKRVPQDGRIAVNVGGEDLDLRVSSVPASHGESIVMRLLSKKGLDLGLPKLGFFSDDQATFERLIASPDGILLITGPTGSGKTTTLYAVLNSLNRPDRKIITVEDPVEYQLSGINQVSVRADIGMDFPLVLKAMMRQAPNIIMVGEIRDPETAEIAITAALTGHLVFSTLHTNDAPSAVPRLLDIGVEPFLLASSLRATMAQRLVRVICEKCKAEAMPSDLELRLLGDQADQFKNAKVYAGKGCNACVQTGYKGRKGIFEIFIINDEVKRMIYKRVSADEIMERARAMGMRTLREDGIRKVLAGITTLSEVLSAG